MKFFIKDGRDIKVDEYSVRKVIRLLDGPIGTQIDMMTKNTEEIEIDLRCIIHGEKEGRALSQLLHIDDMTPEEDDALTPSELALFLDVADRLGACQAFYETFCTHIELMIMKTEKVTNYADMIYFLDVFKRIKHHICNDVLLNVMILICNAETYVTGKSQKICYSFFHLELLYILCCLQNATRPWSTCSNLA
jgi:hypothetical protein